MQEKQQYRACRENNWTGNALEAGGKQQQSSLLAHMRVS